MGSAVVERRRHVRYPFERHLEVRVPDGTLLVRAHDISESGFSFATEVTLKVGDHVMLALRSDNDVLVGATVRSVRTQGNVFIVGAERDRAA